MKNFFLNPQNRLDELVFEGRNKSYGAYALRHDSGAILTKSLLYSLFFLGAVSAVPFIYQQIKSPVEAPSLHPETGGRILVNVDRNIVKPQTPSTVPLQQKTFNSIVPTPARNPASQTPAPKISQYNGEAVPGIQTIDGTAPAVPYTPPATAVTVPIAVTPPAPAPKPMTNEIPATVDVEASFIGGINTFRTKVADSFNTSDFEGTGETLKAVVTFVVEKDGSISNIKASGLDPAFNRAAEDALRKTKGKWTPAKLKGENVRSYFRFPLTMQFQ